MRTHLDLFSGIGGFSLAAQWAGFQTIAFCEIEPYAQQVLIEKFGAVLADSASTGANGHACRKASSHPLFGNGSPTIHPDIFTLDGTQYRGVTLVTGGFPCQPFSCAGKRRGKEDDRHLWPEMLRVIAEARPAYVLAENVPGIIQMELDNCLSDLEAIGYATGTLVVPACAVDARHRRDRVWILAHRDCGCERGIDESEREASARSSTSSCSETMAHAHQPGLQIARQGRSTGGEDEGKSTAIVGGHQDVSNSPIRGKQRSGSQCHKRELEASDGTPSERRCNWLPEPNVGRVAHGVPARTHRLRALGNAIVPQVAYQILKALP